MMWIIAKSTTIATAQHSFIPTTSNIFMFFLLHFWILNFCKVVAIAKFVVLWELPTTSDIFMYYISFLFSVQKVEIYRKIFLQFWISAKLWLSPSLWCSEKFPPRHPYDETRPEAPHTVVSNITIHKKNNSQVNIEIQSCPTLMFFCSIMLFPWHSHILAMAQEVKARSQISYMATHTHNALRKYCHKSFPEADGKAIKCQFKDLLIAVW